MRPVKGFGLLVAFSMALGILATTPGVASASTAYPLDGGSPASCPTPYTVLKSATKSVAGGYIKVEMVYCSAWSVVWTRAYNYTSGTAWLATGIVRTVNLSFDNRYDYTVGSNCSTFCIDSLAKGGARSFGYKLYWPSTVPVLTFTSTAYYCTSKSPSACGTSVSVTGSPAGSRAVIANLASRYVGYSACGLGGPGFVSPTGYTCPAGNPLPGWCDEYAGFVWANSGLVDTTGLVAGPGGFVGYGSVLQTPHVGDVAIMRAPGTSSSVLAAHVAIVTAINGSRVTMVGGNEGGGAGIVAVSYWTPGSDPNQRTPDDGMDYYVSGYVSPHFK